MLKKKTFWGVLGTLLIIYGVVFTISTAIRGEAISNFLFPGAGVIMGVLLIAWVFGD